MINVDGHSSTGERFAKSFDSKQSKGLISSRVAIVHISAAVFVFFFLSIQSQIWLWNYRGIPSWPLLLWHTIPKTKNQRNSSIKFYSNALEMNFSSGVVIIIIISLFFVLRPEKPPFTAFSDIKKKLSAWVQIFLGLFDDWVYSSIPYVAKMAS